MIPWGMEPATFQPVAQCLYLLRLGVPRRPTYRGGDKSLAQPTSRCILFDAENISFDANLVIYI